MQPIQFARRFQLWTYTVSHRQLLLRSTKTDGFPTRIDVLFKNVLIVNLPTTIDNLRVVEADSETRRRLMDSAAAHASPSPESSHVYLIEGSGATGCVIAGYVGVSEDRGEYDDPSPLLD